MIPAISLSLSKLSKALLAAFVILLISRVPIAVASNCGDIDASGRIDITDAVYLINYIFAGGAVPQDDAAGDFDCSQRTDISDAVFMINFIFASGPAPCNSPTCLPGVLLIGDPDSLALNATADLFPIAAGEDDVDSKGFIRTKLEAIIDPAATIGSVNAALNQFNARISSMVEGIPFVSLMVPGLFNRASADSLAALMAPSSAFAYVFPAYAPGNDSLVVTTTAPSMRPAITPGGSADDNLGHLIRMKMPAAWNFKEMIPAGQKVSVVVPDQYYSLAPSPEISAQRFVPGGNATIDAFGDYYSGNHGFHVSGILGANFDAQGATGTHPDAAAHLDLMSMPIGGWDFTDVLHGLTMRIGESLPTGQFVLNTSIGYNDPEFVKIDKFKRAFDMLQWRFLVANRQTDFVHTTAAGNAGTTPGDGGIASFASPFCAATRFSAPSEMLAGVSLTPDQTSLLNRLVTLMQVKAPEALLPLNNVIIVGSNYETSGEFPTSNKQPDVHCVGELVFGPCVITDPNYLPNISVECSGASAYYSGTSMASPQVAGLAAYLWNLNPLLTVTEIRDIILASNVNGQVDAYRAVLSLDKDIFTAVMRLELLDVADASLGGQPGRDGVFDEHDIQLLLDRFAFFENERLVNGSVVDLSRYDLNGDGFTGGNTFATRFDLDINDPPDYSIVNLEVGTASHQFDENLLNDLDILCYYANTTLYSGPQDALETLLVDCPACDQANKSPNGCFDPWVMEIMFPSTIYQTNPAPLQVRIGRTVNGVTIWQQNISIQLSAVGGIVSPESGLTNLDGYFNSTANIAQLSDGIDINVTARDQGNIVATGLAHAVKSGAIHIYARETAAYGTFGSLSITPPCPPCYFGPFTASSSGSDADGSSIAINFSSVDTSSATNEIIFHFSGSSGAGNSDIHRPVTAYGSSSWKFQIFGSQDVAYSWEFSGSSSASYGSAGFGLIVLDAGGRDWFHEFLTQHRGGVQQGDLAGSGTLFASESGYRVAADTYALGGTPTGSGSASLSATLRLVIPPGALLRISAEPNDTAVGTR